MKKLCLVMWLQLLTPQSSQKHQVTLRWTPPVPNGTTIAAIQIFRSTSANLSNVVQVCNVQPTVTSCVDQTGKPNVTYWYYETTLGTQGVSEKSNVVKITIQP